MSLEKEHVLEWKHLMRRQNRHRPELVSKFLSDFRAVLENGKVSVFCAHDAELLDGFGYFLVEQIAMREPDLLEPRVLVFCLHQSAHSYLEGLALNMAGISRWTADRGYLSDKDKAPYEEARARIEGADIRVVDAMGMTLEDIEVELRKVSESDEFGLVLIDSLWDCRCRGGDVSELGWSITGSRLSRLARYWYIPVVVLAPVPRSMAESSFNLFDQLGVFRAYVDQAVILKRSERISTDDNHAWRVEVEPAFGAVALDQYHMELDLRIKRFYEEGTFSPDPTEAELIEEAVSEKAGAD